MNALRAFEAVGKHLSFTGGAAALSVSQSAMSRHVAGLEQLLGKQLFERDSGRLSLTPAGEELLGVVAKSLDRIEITLNAIRDDTMPGRALRLHVPPSLLQQTVLPMLADFHREYPDIRIDVSSSHVTGLPQGDIDMAIVYDRPNVDDMVTDLLWQIRVAPLCSPEIARNAEGKTLAEFLAGEELLHMRLDNQPREYQWAAYLAPRGISLPLSRGLTLDTAIALARYAMSSGGVVLGDIDMLADEISSGQLVMPFDDTSEDGYGYYFKFHADDLADADIALFRSWLIARFAAMRQS
ncbi:LysR substrate-binding domain-containing protein [Novosphingobium sp.]|uniref:LysR substrate-binding domain-containing protein n=1 Tax=Novosphingobium sp. TaxID=1874826 RepID=UPI0025EC8A76|nr:LysR substrate-binding domain-containing protein [Novosphingobium sp.]